MNPAGYRAPSAGELIRSLRGDITFVPAPLPPALSFDTPLVLALSRADAALSELGGGGRLMPNPHLFIAPYLRREAVLSSRIEGTRTNLDQLLKEEAAPRAIPDADLREVQNYVVALEEGIALLGQLPLSLRLVREMHARLMRDVRGGAATPGEFRREQNWIGGSTIDTAVYVPPPPERLEELLGGWEIYLHDRTFPDLIQIALLHEQFEAIHPFRDGNGRLGRLLVPLFLIERGRLPQPLCICLDIWRAIGVSITTFSKPSGQMARGRNGSSFSWTPSKSPLAQPCTKRVNSCSSVNNSVSRCDEGHRHSRSSMRCFAIPTSPSPVPRAHLPLPFRPQEALSKRLRTTVYFARSPADHGVGCTYPTRSCASLIRLKSDARSGRGPTEAAHAAAPGQRVPARLSGPRVRGRTSLVHRPG